MLSNILTLLATQFSIFDATASAKDSSQVQQPWPNGPFTTSGSWILDASNNNVTYAGVNWPGAAETMVPEGLQYQSIESIVSRIKSLGMNSIRLTYATELIDQIYDNNMTDVPIRTSFTNALGVTNGTRVFESVVANNPSLGNSTTRLQVRSMSLEIGGRDVRNGCFVLMTMGRCMMRLLPNVQSNKFTCIWIIIFPRLLGAAIPLMAIPGGTILISLLRIGHAVFHTWLIM